MKDPSLALQAAIFAALEAHDVPNVYSVVPDRAALPWCVIGNDQILAAYDSAEMYECFADVHVFAQKPRHKSIAAKAMSALNRPIEIDGFGVVESGFEETRQIDDKDNQVGHLVMTFRYLVQPY